MEVSRIISEIDAQISKLQQARALLSETESMPAGEAPVKRAGRGRPKGSKNSVKKAAAVKTPSAAVVPAKAAAKRKLSPEGRKRIAEAMKQRWAERRKVTPK